MTPVDPGAPIDGYEPPPYTDPPIYDDPAAYDDIVYNSQQQYYRLIYDYPKLGLWLHPDIYQYINLKLITNTGVRVFMFNKIRMILDRIARVEGYSARPNRTVAFFNLIMFCIPFYTKIHLKITLGRWEKDIVHNDPDFNTKAVHYRWRKVSLVDIPDEFQSAFMNIIPYNVDEGLFNLAAITTLHDWPIFENMMEYGGLNNLLIVSNWDKIVQKLNENGY